MCAEKRKKMKETEFNLLDEKWIRVRLPDNSIQEVSLTDALLHARDYTDLAGEMPTQDAAMLRLLLAVPLTIFYRVNVRGEDEPLVESDQAIMRWKELWELGAFPEKPIRDYLEKWHERFWLFHPERPFWQVAGLKNGIKFYSKKLNGERSQSNNKIPLFQAISEKESETLSYAEAARWLIQQNGYDERGGRPKPGNKPRHGVGWLGQIGFLAIKGNSLFETIMKNMVFPNSDEIKEKPLPCWEREKEKTEQSTEIMIPLNQPELLTLQSRRISLRRAKDACCVEGYDILGGDYWNPENSFNEKMTVWMEKGKKDGKIVFQPKRHAPSIQLWREFPCMLSADAHKPGVLSWNLQLQHLKILNPHENIVMQIVGIQYDSNEASIKDSFSDTLSMQLAVLNDFKKTWTRRIIDEVKNCEDVAEQLAILLVRLNISSGMSLEKTKKDKDKITNLVKTHFFYEVDVPFRCWINTIDAEVDDPSIKISEWQETCRNIALKMARKIISRMSLDSFVGRRVTIEKDAQKMYTLPKAYNEFQRELWTIYPKTKMKGGTE